jgi:beta-glucosidase
LLFGERDDFGRLPVTFYRSTDDLPDFEDYDMAGRTYRYADREHVEFPFGYGLSYSYHQLWGAPEISEANFTVSGLVSQCNTDCKAKKHRTVVQVYLKNENDRDAPVKQLIAVKSIWTVSFDEKVPFKIALDPFWFRQYNPETGLMEEPKDGTEFTLQVGFSSDDRDLVDLSYTYHNRK